MSDFTLPHHHGENAHAASLHKELMNTVHFSAVSDVFKQLSDPTRVRIFWLLSHQEECVINIAAMLEMSSPAVSHHLRSLAESGLLGAFTGGLTATAGGIAAAVGFSLLAAFLFKPGDRS